MPVKIGKVKTFPNVRADKDQALKILEEASEVYAAWENVDKCTDYYDGFACKNFEGGTCDADADCYWVNHLIDECADLITATANLLAAIGVDDMREAMHACEARNRERGRL